MKRMSKYVLPQGDGYTWVRYIHRRIEQNKNFLGLTTGSPGSGKSWSNVAIAALLDKDFTADQIVFDGLELMTLINSGKLKKGSVIVFEEVGVSASSANWQSTFNKMLNFLFQTFRSLNFILLMNAPHALFADKRIRILLHAKFKAVSINRTTQKTILRPVATQYNEDMDKTYKHRLMVRTPSGRYRIISKWAVPKADAGLIADYEAKKLAFNKSLNAKIVDEFEKIGQPPTENLTALQEKVLNHLKDGKTIDDISGIMGTTTRNIDSHVTALRDKGYKIQSVKDGIKVLKYIVEKN